MPCAEALCKVEGILFSLLAYSALASSFQGHFLHAHIIHEYPHSGVCLFSLQAQKIGGALLCTELHSQWIGMAGCFHSSQTARLGSPS
jgi:hypothetical protein